MPSASDARAAAQEAREQTADIAQKQAELTALGSDLEDIRDSLRPIAVLQNLPDRVVLREVAGGNTLTPATGGVVLAGVTTILPIILVGGLNG